VQIDSSILCLCGKKIFDHKETAGHEAALKLLIRGEKDTLDNSYLKTLSHKEVNTANRLLQSV
jgi:hypothetical protein